MSLEVTLFTDPACPFAFSAEPARLRLAWHYGDQLRWRTRMIVLTLEPGEAEKLAEGAPTLQRRHGMPIDPAPYPRPASSEPACRAVVAARLHAPQAEGRSCAACGCGRCSAACSTIRRCWPRPRATWGWTPASCGGGALAPRSSRPCRRTSRPRAPRPSPRARSITSSAGHREQRRYTAPSYEIRCEADGAAATLPGFHPVEAYEAAIANLAPELRRRPKPGSVAEVLAWAEHPLATAEVAAIAQLDLTRARVELGRVARPTPAGADFYWS